MKNFVNGRIVVGAILVFGSLIAYTAYSSFSSLGDEQTSPPATTSSEFAFVPPSDASSASTTTNIADILFENSLEDENPIGDNDEDIVDSFADEPAEVAAPQPVAEIGYRCSAIYGGAFEFAEFLAAVVQKQHGNGRFLFTRGFGGWGVLPDNSGCAAETIGGIAPPNPKLHDWLRARNRLTGPFPSANELEYMYVALLTDDLMEEMVASRELLGVTPRLLERIKLLNAEPGWSVVYFGYES